MNNKKQYYNNLNPGEKAIESRLGAKILMNEDLTINAAIRPEYLEQLRKEGFQGNVSPSFDDNTSIVYMGNKSVTLDQLGNVTQLSLGIQQSENVIVASENILPTTEEEGPPIITDFNPKKGTVGDKVTIIGSNFVKVRAVLINSIDCAITSVTPTKLEIIVPNIPDVKQEKFNIEVYTIYGNTESKDTFEYTAPSKKEEDITESNYDEAVDKVPNYDGPEPPDEPVVIFTTAIPQGTARGGGPCPTLIINTRPKNGTEALAKDNGGNPTAYYNILCAAKASIGTYTSSVPDTSGGALGCAAAISIIYNRIFGCGLYSNKIGNGLKLIIHTKYLYEAFVNNPTNWSFTEVFNPNNTSSWTPNIVSLFQPGDVILTRTENVGPHGHVGFVSDEKSSDGSYRVINNSSPKGYIVDTGTYSVQTWGKGVAKRKSGSTWVGPTFLVRFIGTIGKTISIP